MSDNKIQNAPTARRAAFDILMKVEREGQFLNLALKELPMLPERDRALATRLAYGVTEQRLRLDHVIAKYCQKRVQPVVRQVLRLGIYQLLCMDRIPESAACDESVELVKSLGKRALAPLVNAVLRQTVRDKIQWLDRDSAFYPADSSQNQSIWYSWPIWLLEKLLASLTDQGLADFLENPLEPGITLRPSGNDFLDYSKKRGWQLTQGRWADVYHLQQTVDIAQDEGYRKGLYSVQSEASAWIARLLDARDGERVLDACSAPGGKAAAIAQSSDCDVECWDVHPHRVELIESMRKRLNISRIHPMVWDAAVFRPELEGQFDRVLIDAPCSGIGTVARKPDLKYRLQPENITELHELQTRILQTCARYVKPGGILVYSTCTLLREENQNVVTKLLQTQPFETDWPQCFPPEVEPSRIAADGFTLLPHVDKLEGFFVCRLKRR